LYISYKVNPAYMPDRFYNFIGRLKDAATGRIAAELPTENCNCPIDWGYIAQQKTPYGDAYIDSSTKFQVDKIRYGETHGQKRYAEIMNEAPKYKKPIWVLS
jgi:hypothetical protein